MDGITRELGYSPTHVHRRGEASTINKSHALDAWIMDSPLGKGQDLEHHLNWLTKQLLTHKGYISSLRKTLTVDIYCYKTCYTEQASLILSPNALLMFTELSMELQVSLIFLPNETDETEACNRTYRE
jgi:hypothetical protein